MSESIYDFEAQLLDGTPQPFAAFRGKVLLIVNTASQCGFTPQLGGLESLYLSFKLRGLEILGFPCNQFGGQEPGSSEEIGHFCQKNYGVSFPIFEKIEVKGPNSHPLYQYLTQQKRGLLGPSIRWNFTKFLVNRQGRVVGRYAPFVAPQRISKAIARQVGLESEIRA